MSVHLLGQYRPKFQRTFEGLATYLFDSVWGNRRTGTFEQRRKFELGGVNLST